MHCKNSTEPRATVSTVVEKTQDIDTDEPSTCGLPEEIPSPQQHVILEMQGLESREEILYPSSPTQGNTLRRIMMKKTENQKKSKREEIHIYSLTLKMSTYLVQRSCTVL